MKRLKTLLFLIIFLIPFVVHAEETTDVTLKDLVLKKTTGWTEVLSDAEIINNKIVLDLKMYEVGDSIEYTFVVDNKSSQDFLVNGSSLMKVDSAIEYILQGKDNSNTVKKNSEKLFTLTVTYKNEVERTAFKGGKYDTSSNIIIELRDPSLINPVTGSIFASLLLTLIVLSVGFMIIKDNKIKALLLVGTILLPLTTYAFYEYNIELESNIIIGYVTPNSCTYDGELVQGAEYTNGQYTYRYMQEKDRTGWKNIDFDGWGVVLSFSSSTDPVTTTLCTSINDKPIVSMNNMFYNSRAISIDTSSFDTSNVVNMGFMFNLCNGITGIDVSQFDTSNVTNMSYMFNHLSNLEEIDVSNFDISNIIDMDFFIANCSSLKKLTFDNLDLTKLSSYHIIASNDNLEEVSFKNWKIPSTFTSAIGCGNGIKMHLCPDNLKYLDVTGWDLSNTTDVSGLFDGYNGKEIIGFDTWNTSSITNMSGMFNRNEYLVKLDLSSFDTSNVTSFGSMFNCCSSITELDLSGFDMSKSSNFTGGGMFAQTSSLKKLNLSNIKLPADMSNSIFRSSGASSSPIEEIDVTEWDLSNTTNLNGVFGTNGSNGKGGTGLKRIIGLDTWDTSNITNMSHMFEGLSIIDNIDVSNFNTSNVTDLSNMFNSCYSLTNMDLSNFDTSHVTDFTNLLNVGSSLKTVNISGFDFSATTLDNIGGMLNAGIETLNISHCNFSSLGFTTNAIIPSMYGSSQHYTKTIDATGIILPSNATYYFGGFSNLNSIVLDDVDTSNVTIMEALFYGCSSLTTLDLSSFNTANVTNTGGMFYNATSLTTMYARTQADADLFNSAPGNPSNINFVVKT